MTDLYALIRIHAQKLFDTCQALLPQKPSFDLPLIVDDKKYYLPYLQIFRKIHSYFG